MTVHVGKDDTEASWIESEMISARKTYRLTLRSRDGRHWTGEGLDLFYCLLHLRNQVEPDGVRLCCHGLARTPCRPGCSGTWERDTPSIC
jgi:hypothetical protein